MPLPGMLSSAIWGSRSEDDEREKEKERLRMLLDSLVSEGDSVDYGDEVPLYLRLEAERAAGDEQWERMGVEPDVPYQAAGRAVLDTIRPLAIGSQNVATGILSASEMMARDLSADRPEYDAAASPVILPDALKRYYSAGAEKLSEQRELQDRYRVDQPESMTGDFWTDFERNPTKATAHYSAIQLPQLALMMGSGMAGGAVAGTAGRTAAGVSSGYLAESGAAYDEARKDDASIEDSITAGTLTGMANMVLEFGPIGRLLNKMGADAASPTVKQWVQGLLGQSLAEGSTETLQEFNNALVAQLTYADEQEWKWKDVVRRMTSVTIPAMVAGGGMHVAAAPLPSQAQQTAPGQGAPQAEDVEGMFFSSDAETVQLALADIQRRLASGEMSAPDAAQKLEQLGRLGQRLTDPHLQELQEVSLGIEPETPPTQVPPERNIRNTKYDPTPEAISSRAFYHGTRSTEPIDSFDLSRGSGDHQWYGPALYLSSNPKSSDKFSEDMIFGPDPDSSAPGALYKARPVVGKVMDLEGPPSPEMIRAWKEAITEVVPELGPEADNIVNESASGKTYKDLWGRDVNAGKGNGAVYKGSWGRVHTMLRENPDRPNIVKALKQRVNEKLLDLGYDALTVKDGSMFGGLPRHQELVLLDPYGEKSGRRSLREWNEERGLPQEYLDRVKKNEEEARRDIARQIALDRSMGIMDKRIPYATPSLTFAGNVRDITRGEEGGPELSPESQALLAELQAEIAERDMPPLQRATYAAALEKSLAEKNPERGDTSILNEVRESYARRFGAPLTDENLLLGRRELSQQEGRVRSPWAVGMDAPLVEESMMLDRLLDPSRREQARIDTETLGEPELRLRSPGPDASLEDQVRSIVRRVTTGERVERSDFSALASNEGWAEFKGSGLADIMRANPQLSGVYKEILDNVGAAYQERNPDPVGRANFIERNFTKQGNWRNAGNLSDFFHLGRQARDANIRVATEEAENVVEDFNVVLDSAAKKVGGKNWKESKASILDSVNEYLTGDETAGVEGAPVSVLREAEKMRSILDGWTRELMSEEGLMSPELREILEGNLGSYLRTMYATHVDPDQWREIVLNKRPELLQDATEFVKDLRNRSDIPWMEDSQIRGYLLGLLARDRSTFFAAADEGAGRIDRGIFKKKKNIPEPIARLLGEVEDPRTRFLESVSRMTNDLYTHQLQNEMAEAGRNIVFFDRKTNEFSEEISGAMSRTPLAGKYTTPELKATIEGTFGAAAKNTDFAHRMFDSYLQANGWVKGAMTAYNPPTHGRNVIAWSYISLMSGHNPLVPLRAAKAVSRLGADKVKRWAQSKNYAAMDDAVAEAAVSVGLAKSTEAWRSMRSRWVELGVAGESVMQGETSRYIDWTRKGRPKDLSDGQVRGVKEKIRHPLKTATGGLRAGMEGMSYLYGLEDDLGKIYIAEAETKDLMKQGMSREDAEIMAASIIRDITPTWSNAWKAADTIRKFPILGMFPTFHMERLRNNGNLYRLIRDEITSGNPQKIKMGARRLGGVLTTLSIPASIGLLLRAAFDIDDEKDVAIRRRLGFWERFGQYIPLGIDKDHIFFFDMSFMDPDTPFKNAFRALLVGIRTEDKEIHKILLDAAGEFLSPFVGDEALVSGIVDLWRNRKESGGNVYNPEETLPRRAGEASYYALRRLGGGARTVDNLRVAVTGGMDEYANTRSLPQELITMAGPRLRSVNFEQSVRLGDAREFSDRYQNDRRIFYRRAMDVRNIDTALPDPFNPGPDNPLTHHLVRANQQFGKTYRDLVRNIREIRRLGMGDETLYKAMTSYTPQVPDWVMESAMAAASSDTRLRDIRPPPLFTDEDFDKMEEKRMTRAEDAGVLTPDALGR